MEFACSLHESVSIPSPIEVNFYPLQAAELLGNRHLQPYVLKIQMKINCPRRNTLPAQWPEDARAYRKYRYLSSNNRALNPSISGAEHDSVCSTEGRYVPSYLNERFEELSVGSTQGTVICKPIYSKASSVVKNPKISPAKASATPKKRTEPLRKRESVKSETLLLFTCTI